VGVIDTGILPHADLTNRTLPGYDFISTAFVGNDGDGRDSNPVDSGDWSAYGECYTDSPASGSSWHGTHVAGTIGAASDNGYGVAGVNWTSRIVPVRVLGKCGGYTSDIADAIRWTAGLSVGGAPINQNPAQVINMSLGGAYTCGATSAMQLAINDAVANGAVVVVAAGNSSMDAAGYTPAGCNNVVAVAANNRAGSRTYYSNYGETVEIAAPGGEVPLNPGGILSTLDSGSMSPLGDNVFAFYQGTSMAAPHVAGVVSLMASAHYALTNNHLPSSVLVEKLLVSARTFPSGSSCTQVLCGEGIADAARAVAAVTTAPNVDAGGDQSVGTGQLVTLSGLVDDDGAVSTMQWVQVAGPGVSLSGSNGATTSFTAGSESTVLTFELYAIDDVGLGASDTVNVVVVEPVPAPVPEPDPEPVPTPVENSVPVATDLVLVTEKNTPVSAVLSATDADDDSLTYQIVSAPANGSVSLDPMTGVFTYTPKRRYTGTDSFSYVANDGGAGSVAASVSITVNGGAKGGGKTSDGGGSKKGGPKK
jgi:subtilisin family serine protease